VDLPQGQSSDAFILHSFNRHSPGTITLPQTPLMAIANVSLCDGA
jgi:hypothetical protein